MNMGSFALGAFSTLVVEVVAIIIAGIKQMIKEEREDKK